MAFPACYGCIFLKKGQGPTYIVEKQPIFRPGKDNTTPVGYIKSVRLDVPPPCGQQNEPIMITVDVPGANEEEQALLLILAYALDPRRIGFIHDTPTNFTNQYMSTVEKNVTFDTVLAMTLASTQPGGAPAVPDMTR